jgi:outer membrane protein
MKKIISSLAIATTLATSLSADFLRIEAGAGVWDQTPSGYIERTDGDGALELKGRYTSSENSSTEFYMWALFKHPIPLIPNARVEYVSMSDEGTFSAGTTVGHIPLGDNAIGTLDIKQYDLIPYYNILDNTMWITIDLGIDLKYTTTDAAVDGKIPFIDIRKTIYTGSDSFWLPLVYVRGRVEVPGTGLGIESDVKYITDGDSTVYDIRAKVDYTFDVSEALKLGLELGYRTQKYDIIDGKDKGYLTYDGVYFGGMLRF